MSKTIRWISIEDAVHPPVRRCVPGERPRRRMGAVARLATRTGGLPLALTACGRPLSGGKAFAPSGADALGLCSLPGILSSAVATGRAGTLDFGPVVSPADSGRTVARNRAGFYSALPFATPSPRRAGGMTHVGRCAVLVRRAPTSPGHTPVCARVLGRRVDGREV